MDEDDLKHLAGLHTKYGEATLFAEIKRLTRGKPIFRRGRRGITSADGARDFARWVDVTQALRAHPDWKPDAAYDLVATEQGVSKSAIRRSYKKVQDSLGNEVRKKLGREPLPTVTLGALLEMIAKHRP